MLINYRLGLFFINFPKICLIIILKFDIADWIFHKLFSNIIKSHSLATFIAEVVAHPIVFLVLVENGFQPNTVLSGLEPVSVSWMVFVHLEIDVISWSDWYFLVVFLNFVPILDLVVLMQRTTEESESRVPDPLF